MSSSLKKNQAARVPLFDRLTDENPKSLEEPVPLRTLDKEQLRESIFGEINRLLNTRCPRAIASVRGRGRSVVDYGLPEITPYLDNHRFASAGLDNLLKETIEGFEPRLKNVRPQVLKVQADTQGLVVAIEADMVVGAHFEPVRFEISANIRKEEDHGR